MNSPLSKSAGSKQEGFTLLELLVASAVMGIVLFALVSTANTSLQLWRDTSSKAAVDREGRTGLALLSWDLQNIVQPTNVALRPHINTNEFTANDTTTTVLQFLTLKPRDYQTNSGDVGDVCYVEYRIEDGALKRAFVGSEATFTAIAGGNFPSGGLEFQTLVTNLWAGRFWGLQATATNVDYDGSYQQTSAAEVLRAVEYRLGLLDQKFMDLYRDNPALAEAQGTKSLRWYQAMQHVPSPSQ
jgi:prepilin-type N-terminal cleavage/methylation domain-containing protein